MPRPRFGNLAENKRKSILEAASLEFFERGYGGASVNRIIEAAGISKGAMYYYFDDKEDLFFTVIQDIQDRVFEAVGTLPAVKTPVEFWQEADGFFRYPFMTTLPRIMTSPMVSPSAGTRAMVSGSMTVRSSSAA